MSLRTINRWVSSGCLEEQARIVTAMREVRTCSDRDDKGDQSVTHNQYSSGVPTIITWSQEGNNVYVTGTFNGWKHKIKLVKR